MIYKTLALACIFLLSGCSIGSPTDRDKTSSGSCYAEPEKLKLVGNIDPAYTHFYRDDRHFFIEKAFVNIRVVSTSTGDDLLVVDAHFDDMPNPRYENTYDFSGRNYIDIWDVLVPVNAITTGGSFQIKSANRKYVSGTFTVQYQNHPSITCDISLGRKYSLDTDD